MLNRLKEKKKKEGFQKTVEDIKTFSSDPSNPPTSQTPQRLRFAAFSLSSSFSFFSICSEKKVSKIKQTNLVVVALVGPLSLSILVGCLIACLLAARLERGSNREELGPCQTYLAVYWAAPGQNETLETLFQNDWKTLSSLGMQHFQKP